MGLNPGYSQLAALSGWASSTESGLFSDAAKILAHLTGFPPPRLSASATGGIEHPGLDMTDCDTDDLTLILLLWCYYGFACDIVDCIINGLPGAVVTTRLGEMVGACAVPLDSVVCDPNPLNWCSSQFTGCCASCKSATYEMSRWFDLYFAAI